MVNKPVYGELDFRGQLVLPLSATPPASPINGSVYIDSDDGLVYTYTSGSWHAGGGGLQTRTTANITTASLAQNASESSTVTLADSYRLLGISTTRPARVRLYTTATARTADASRTIGTYPIGNHGLIFEYITATGALSGSITPSVDGYDGESSPTGVIAYHITNLDSSTGTVGCTLTWIQTE